jgi:hypothetical protein
VLGKRLAVAHVVGVGDEDNRSPAEGIEVRFIVVVHGQRVDNHVAAVAHPQHAVKIDVAVLVKDRPTEQIATMQLFHSTSIHRGSGHAVRFAR